MVEAVEVPQEEESPLDAATAEQAANVTEEPMEVGGAPDAMHDATAGIVDQINEEENAARSPLEEFLDGLDDPEVLGPVIYITSTTTGRMVVPAEEDHTCDGVPGYSIREILREAMLTIRPGATQFWVEGNQADMDFVLPIGATLTVIGPVKGG